MVIRMINFNVPPFTGRELEYIRQAVENQKICGDGPFTQKCSAWIEEKTGTAKCLLTPSCTQANELAALLIDIKEGDEVILPSYTLYQLQTPLCCVVQRQCLSISVLTL